MILSRKINRKPKPNKMKKILLIVLFWVSIQSSYAQGISINTTGAPPDSSAMLDVSDTSKGILITRMTMAQRDAIVSPANSLLIFQTNNDSGFYYYNAPTLTWVKLGQNLVNYCSSVIPMPSFPETGSAGGGQNSNTTAYMGQILISAPIITNQITVENFGIPSIPGKVKIGLYTDDGQTKVFEITTNDIVGAGLVTTILSSSKLINSGYYYLVVVPIETASVNLITYARGSVSANFLKPPGKNILQGTITVPANTLPTAFDPTTIIYSEPRCIQSRLDN